MMTHAALVLNDTFAPRFASIQSILDSLEFLENYEIILAKVSISVKEFRREYICIQIRFISSLKLIKRIKSFQVLASDLYVIFDLILCCINILLSGIDSLMYKLSLVLSFYQT